MLNPCFTLFYHKLYYYYLTLNTSFCFVCFFFFHCTKTCFSQRFYKTSTPTSYSAELSPGLMAASPCSALETLGLWWIMLKGNIQEERKHFTLRRANIHTHMHAHTRHTNTHKHHHPEVLHDWEVIKEAQRSVKVKGQRSNQSGVKH